MPHMYILECSDGSYYIGSTWNLERRLWEHQNGLGANHTKKRLPVKLVYCEHYDRVEDAFHREKQVQGWSRRKKQALIENNSEDLIEFSKNYTQYGRPEERAARASASTTASASTGSASAPMPPRLEQPPLPEPVEGSTPTKPHYPPLPEPPLPEPVEGSTPTKPHHPPLPEPVEGSAPTKPHYPPLPEPVEGSTAESDHPQKP